MIVERELGRFLVVFGVLLALVGVALFFGSRIGLGRLPGDISVTRGNFRFYAPLGTSLLLSILLSVVLSLLIRMFSR
jgi:Protein of unknown function (DUF2905)